MLFALRGIDRRIKRAVAALATLAMVSVTVLTLGYREPDGTGMSVLDALYFTVETIGTVGFGDFYFRDQHAWLRAWAIFLMVVGATLATVFFALLTNVLISRTIASSLGRRRMTGLAVRDLPGERWWDVPVVLRIFDRRLAGTVSGSFDFRNVRSPSALAAPHFVGAALGIDVLQTLYVGGLPMVTSPRWSGPTRSSFCCCAADEPTGPVTDSWVRRTPP